MNWLQKIISRIRLRKGLHGRFKVRDILELAKTREKFRYLILDQQKKKNKDIELLNKYNNYVECLDWVLNESNQVENGSLHRSNKHDEASVSNN